MSSIRILTSDQSLEQKNELLVVFTRTPRFGKVKTRLIPPLSPELALELHQAFLEDTLENVEHMQRLYVNKLLCLSEPLKQQDVLNIPTTGWEIELKVAGTLGKRLEAIFLKGFNDGHQRVVVIGSDSPTLPNKIINEAFDQLTTTKTVIGPAEDGGYYLIGCNKFIPQLFQDIDWGTSKVLSQTLRVTESLQVETKILPTWYDIDCSNDLEKLRNDIKRLEGSKSEFIPHRSAAVLSNENKKHTFKSDTKDSEA